MSIFNNSETNKTLIAEGGYDNSTDDLGGETNGGISKRQYPHLGIRALTVDQILAIHYEDFWVKYRISEINSQVIAEYIHDMNINSGPKNAALCVQKALASLNCEINIDGILGSETIKLINQLLPSQLLDRLKLERVRYYLKIVQVNKTQIINFSGWIKRALWL